jgi:NADH-quinone oxidoreductase subunit J
MPAEIPFYLMAALTVGGAIAAMSLRNLVHCALCAAAAFAGLAGIYLQLNAEFVGVAQFLVYVGAIAILIVFTVLLTRGADVQVGAPRASAGWLGGLIVAALVTACIVTPILKSPTLRHEALPGAVAPVKRIGEELMSGCVLPLETIGLLLTAALVGAVVIAMNDKPAVARSRKMKLPEARATEEVSLR